MSDAFEMIAEAWDQLHNLERLQRVSDELNRRWLETSPYLADWGASLREEYECAQTELKEASAALAETGRRLSEARKAADRAELRWLLTGWWRGKPLPWR
jgi:hypothetical protein